MCNAREQVIEKSTNEFNLSAIDRMRLYNTSWDHIIAPTTIDQLLPPYVTRMLYELACGELSHLDTVVKQDVRNQLLKQYGFTFAFSGTNRVVYSYDYDSSFLIKIGLDSQGRQDNIDEYYNSPVLFPVCTKVFGLSKDSIVEMVEKVIPILNKSEALDCLSGVIESCKIIEQHNLLLDDINYIRYYKNWGVRSGLTVPIPVVLDFSGLSYRIPDKAICKARITRSDGSYETCGGEISYDEWHDIRCLKCGKKYKASQVGLTVREAMDLNDMKVKKGECSNMKPLICKITRGNGKIYTYVIGGDKGRQCIDIQDSAQITTTTDETTESRCTCDHKVNNKYLLEDLGNNVMRCYRCGETFTMMDHEQEHVEAIAIPELLETYDLKELFHDTLYVKLKEKYHVDIDERVCEFIANYLAEYCSKFICMPSVLMLNSLEDPSLIKKKLTEEAGDKVTEFNKIAMGIYNMYIAAKPIINRDKFVQCIETALSVFLQEECDADGDDDARDTSELANVINEITNDETVTFDKPADINNNTASVNNYQPFIINTDKITVGDNIISTDDAVEVKCKSTIVDDEEF